MQYVGWGGLKELFAPAVGGRSAKWEQNWGDQHRALRALLTDEEWASASSSTSNAHYTSAAVIRAMWKGLRELGFTGGTVHEPAVGVGHFFGLMPIRAGTKMIGADLDDLSARIAAQLYQGASIRRQGFQDAAITPGSVDLFISNVPFAGVTITDAHDPELTNLNASLHDFFFAKAVKALRPGGVAAFITSRFTADKIEPKVREWIAERAHLVGMVRLPRTAFQGIARTEVVTDIIILQKKTPGEPPRSAPAWSQSILRKVGDELVYVNQYYHDHPEHVLGTLSMTGTMRAANELTVEPIGGQNLETEIANALSGMPIDKAAFSATARDLPAAPTPAGPSDAPEYSTVVRGGRVYTVTGGTLVPYPSFPADAKGTWAARVASVAGVRDAALRLRSLEVNPDANSAAVESAREALDRAYDAHLAEYGPVSTPTNRRFFSSDPAYGLLLALEDYDQDAKTATKAAIFTKRLSYPVVRPATADNPLQALGVSMTWKGVVDPDYMAELTGRPREEVLRELGDAVFENPEGGWESAAQYLSGNVRVKLANARIAAEKDQRFARNVAALEKAVPPDKGIGEIDPIMIGSSWVPAGVYQEFLGHLIGSDTRVRYSPTSGDFALTVARGGDPIKNTREYGTQRRPALDLFERLLNSKDVAVYDTVDHPTEPGKTIQVLNVEESAAANDRKAKIEQEWQRWLFLSVPRVTNLMRLYNDLFNADATARFDGSHLAFPGMSELWKQRAAPHQKAAVWRMITTGNTLLAHVVGAGKTFTLVAGAMEMKRLGLLRKPVFVVPNHLVAQWVKEFAEIYPGAKILAPTAQDFSKGRRVTTANRIATGDWDAVIMPISQFVKLPLSPERYRAIFNREIAAMRSEIEEAKRQKGQDRNYVAEMENKLRQLEERLKKQLAAWNKDKGTFFDELGIDALFVDEAHEFKNLFFATRMTRIPGIATQPVQKTFDMWTKTEYLNEARRGRGVFFATGTPVANSMTEAYTMFRYLAPGMLARSGMSRFDPWARQFGVVEGGPEVAPDGAGFRWHSRFSKFVNLPVLSQMFRSFSDVLLREDLTLPVPEIASGTSLGMDVVKGAKDLPVSRSPQLAGIVAELVERARRIKDKEVTPIEDNMLSVVGDGRKAALDLRLYDAALPDLPDSKLNTAIGHVFTIWRQTADLRGTQIVWSDLGTPKDKAAAETAPETESVDEDADSGEASAVEEVHGRDTGFDLYADMKRKLIARGVPAEQIAFIHDAKNDRQRRELFAKVNAGKVRILIGSTAKLGTGANIQKRLVAAHHLDAPWKPAEVEQRDGRIIRRGNEVWDTHRRPIEIYRYITQNSFDSYSWQTLEKKARYIASFMTGKGNLDAIGGDLGAQVMEFAQMKAVAANNPKLFELAEVQAKLKQIEASERQFLREQFNDRMRVENELPRDIAYWRQKVEALTTVTANRPDLLAVRTAAGVLSKRADVAAALLEASRRMVNGVAEVGEVWGLTLRVAWDGQRKYLRVGPLLIEAGDSAEGNAARLVNFGEKAYDELDLARQYLDGASSRLEELKGQLDRPFEKAAELTELRERFAGLEKEINQEAKSAAERKPPGAAPTPPGNPGEMMRWLDAMERWAMARAVRRGPRVLVTLAGVRPPPDSRLRPGATSLNADAERLLALGLVVAIRAAKTLALKGRSLTALTEKYLAEYAAKRPGDKLPPASAVRKIAVGFLRDTEGDVTKIERAYTTALYAIARRAARSAAAQEDREIPVLRALAQSAARSPEGRSLAATAASQAAIMARRDALNDARGWTRAAIEAVKKAGAEREMVMEGLRQQVINFADALPLPVRGRFVRVAGQIRTPVELARAVNRMAKQLALFEARGHIRHIRRLARRKVLAKLDQNTRQAMQLMIDMAAGHWKTIAPDPARAGPVTSTIAVKVEAELRRLREGMEEMIALYRAERARTKYDRRRTLKEIAFKVAERASATPSREKDRTLRAVHTSTLTKGAVLLSDLRNVLATVEGKADGYLEKIIWQSLADADERRLTALRTAQERIEAIVRKAGFTSLADAIGALSEAGGEGVTKTVDVTLGQRRWKVPLGVALSMVAADPETRRVLWAGAPVQIGGHTGRADRAEVLPGDLERIEDELDPKLVAMVREFKRVFHDLRPEVFAVVKLLRGYEPPAVYDYWPRVRNLAVGGGSTSDTAILVESLQKLVPTMLENAGFTEQRTNAVTPAVVFADVMSTVLDHVDMQLRIAHLAVPIRDAVTVWNDTLVSDAVNARHGAYVHRAVARAIIDVSGAERNYDSVAARAVYWINQALSVSHLALNPRTWMKQTTGWLRLLPFVRLDDLVYGLTRAPLVSQTVMEQHSGYFWDRYEHTPADRMSPATVTADGIIAHHPTARSMLHMLKNAAALDARGVVRDWTRFGRSFLRALNFFDALIAKVAWAAMTREVRRTRPDLRPGTGVFLDQVGRRAAALIRETQNGSSRLDTVLGVGATRGKAMSGLFLWTSDALKAHQRFRRALRRSKAQAVAVFVAEVVTILANAVLLGGLGYGLAKAVSGAIGGEDDEEIRQRTLALDRMMVQAAREALQTLVPIGGLGQDAARLAEKLMTGKMPYGKSDGLTPPFLSTIAEMTEQLVLAANAGINVANGDVEEAWEKFYARLARAGIMASEVAGNPFAAPMKQVINEVRVQTR